MIKKIVGILIISLMGMANLVMAGATSFANTSGMGAVTNKITNVPGGDENTASDSFLDVVQKGINWVLGIIGLIALIILLWGGFMMITAAGDDGKYKKGFTILKQAAVGLIMIGVAWLILKIIFFVIATATV